MLSTCAKYWPPANHGLCIYRYGLPVNFQAILVHPNKKSLKRLRDALNQLYSHLDSSATGGAGDVSMCVNLLYRLNHIWGGAFINSISSFLSQSLGKTLVIFFSLFSSDCGHPWARLQHQWIFSLCVLQDQHRYDWWPQELRVELAASS